MFATELLGVRALGILRQALYRQRDHIKQYAHFTLLQLSIGTDARRNMEGSRLKTCIRLPLFFKGQYLIDRLNNSDHSATVS